MYLYFGLELDEAAPVFENLQPAPYCCGESGLLRLLEKAAGLSYPDQDEYLRIEQYRQIAALYLQQCPNERVFYAKSYGADPLAAAEALLARRDELLLAGWDFAIDADLPLRLETFARLEALQRHGQPCALSVGKAERWLGVERWLRSERCLPIERLGLNEPLRLLPPFLQRLIALLQELGCRIDDYRDVAAAPEHTALGKWQRALLRQPFDRQTPTSREDHSIVLLEGRRETALAAYLAQLFAGNPELRPLCLIPGQNRALDNALIQEGLPSPGILSASHARPSLQILKLVSAFLCEPVNPYKILEFLSLPNRPLHRELARNIAEIVAEKPGLSGSALHACVSDWLEDMQERIGQEPNKKRQRDLHRELEEAQFDYEFLFQRRRYDLRQPIPKSEIASVFRFLHRWASRRVEEVNERTVKLQDEIARQNRSALLPKDIELLRERDELHNRLQPLLALQEQSDRVRRLVDALPEQESTLSLLQLERLVRTVSQASPVRFRLPEQGCLPVVYLSSAIAEPRSEVLWWNFVRNEAPPAFPLWYAAETERLLQLGIRLETPQAKNARRLWQTIQPILRCTERLFLAMPEFIDGRSTEPHLLSSDLEALFGEENLQAWRVDTDARISELPDWWHRLYVQPQEQMLAVPSSAPLELPTQLQLPGLKNLLVRTSESFTSLESLLYIPHKWVFRYLMELSPKSLNNIVSPERLKGNLAHGVFEFLFQKIKQNPQTLFERERIPEWAEQKAEELIRKEGVVLLMYGKEPERVNFIKKIKRAALALTDAIRENEWSVEGVEQDVSGCIDGKNLVGKIDLVLRNAQGKRFVLDIKWGGLNRRKEQLSNNRDLQLVLYAQMLDQGKTWADTGFFIVEQARILARNRKAFADALLPGRDPIDDTEEIHRRIYQALLKTYRWRMNQLEQGIIELRTEENFERVQELLQAELGQELMDLLEMRSDLLQYDDYKNLIKDFK